MACMRKKSERKAIGKYRTKIATALQVSACPFQKQLSGVSTYCHRKNIAGMIEILVTPAVIGFQIHFYRIHSKSVQIFRAMIFMILPCRLLHFIQSNFNRLIAIIIKFFIRLIYILIGVIRSRNNYF